MYTYQERGIYPETPMGEFMDTVFPVTEGFSPSGVVVVVGHGPACPERVLVCTPDSRYRKPFKMIRTLVFCDPEYFNPAAVLDCQIEETLPPKIGRGVHYCSLSLQEFLPYIPEGFIDSILLFRVGDLEKQLRRGLLSLVEEKVKRGGIFIGSGDFQTVYSFQEIVGKSGFSIVKWQRLSNPDYSGYTYTTHIGFRLEKR